MVVTMTLVMPNCFSGPSAIARPMVEQFGLVTIWPFQPRARCWPGTSLRWSGLISGTSSGTSCSMRWLRELETTTCPACAKARSISVATPASMAEKSRRGALPGLHSSTVRSATVSGVPPARCHVMASLYFLPAERSLAPSHLRSNHGLPCRNLMKCWPTMPVAPRMPTSIRVCIIPLRCVDRVPQLRVSWALGTRSSSVCAT